MTYRYVPLPAERLEPIAEMAQGISAATTLAEVFRALFLFATDTTAADSIFVALYNPASELRRCVYAANVITDHEGRRQLEEDSDLSVYPDLPLNDGPQSRAILTGDLVNSPNLAAALQGLPRVDTGSDFEENPPLSSLAVPFSAESRVLGAIEVQSTRPAAFANADLPSLKMGAKLAAIAVQNLHLLERERAQHEATLRALGIALEYRDYETKGHTDRVVALSLAFGEALAFQPDQLQALQWGAYLHDIGKVAIPDRILLKPGSLSEKELAQIRRHTLIGIDMCTDIPFLPTDAREIVRSHHEHWNGRGYPDALAEEEIPLMARMFSLVDVYDALTSERPYKQAWTHEKAIEEIRKQAGKQFDPKLVDPFSDVVQRSREQQLMTKVGKQS